VRVQLGALGGVRAHGNEEHAGDFVRRLGQRHAVLERVDDSIGARPRAAHDVVQRGLVEREIDEGHATPAARRDARDIPGGLRRPGEIVGQRHHRDQRRGVDQRRHQRP
jgi:hypothetical protein